MCNLTVILNGYRRPEYLKEQIEAIKNQSVPIDIQIALFNNWSEKYNDFDPELLKECFTVRANSNLGVWARFTYALNFSTPFLAVLDDDTIPGTKWFENCFNTMEKKEGLIGCRGLRFNGNDYYNYPSCHYQSFGPGYPNEEPEEVDIIGHCWFFKREWLRAYWAELPPMLPQSGGEDMHFSYAIQKHFGLPSIIAPHPRDDKEMWGSVKCDEYGSDMKATSRTMNGFQHANGYWRYILGQGYRLVKDKK